MKQRAKFLAIILLLAAAGLYLADRYHTDLEIRTFDYQMSEWKNRERFPERE